jgi:hypothetical protein
MPKVSHQVRARAARRPKKPQALKAWMEAQYRATPGLRQRVNALVRAMLREQDAARPMPKPSGQRKARRKTVRPPNREKQPMRTLANRPARKRAKVQLRREAHGR